jgi:hypothetical protein
MGPVLLTRVDPCQRLPQDPSGGLPVRVAAQQHPLGHRELVAVAPRRSTCLPRHRSRHGTRPGGNVGATGQGALLTVCHRRLPAGDPMLQVIRGQRRRVNEALCDGAAVLPQRGQRDLVFDSFGDEVRPKALR